MMRDRGPILVPLDGSELAERALPYAVALARALEKRLALVCVWEGNDSELAAAMPSVALEIEAGAREHFSEYLRKIEARTFEGVPVQAQFLEGNVAEEIQRAADGLDAAAIVIATHGRSGIGRWLYGSTASHLLHHASAPLLAVGPRALARDAAAATFRHIMVPLDGSVPAEAALPLARSLASATGARISLVRCVQWAVQSYPFTLPDPYIPQVDEELEKGAKAYLLRKEPELDGAEVRAFVVRGGVAEGLIDFAANESVDLIVMSTRGRSGIMRAALGSAADRVLQGPAPVLLLSPRE